ncbi:hypothetical protein WG66_002487 [Moniliophthora roreri]|nr:hypothetical protein WG66_002487 [Moniliophthora roreri]
MDTAVKNIRIVVTEYAYNWPPDISPCHKDQWGAAWENEKCMRTCDSPNRDGSGHTQKSPHNVGFTSSTFLSLDHLCHLAIPGSSYLPLGLRKWPLLVRKDRTVSSSRFMHQISLVENGQPYWEWDPATAAR